MPLQASRVPCQQQIHVQDPRITAIGRPTKFFLDDFEDLLLIEFLRQTLDSGQGLTTIALYQVRDQHQGLSSFSLPQLLHNEGVRTLNPNVDVVLRLPSLPSVFVGFGEGVCRCQESQPLPMYK